MNSRHVRRIASMLMSTVLLALVAGGTAFARQANGSATPGSPQPATGPTRVRVKQLRPASGSEVVLPEAWLTSDGSGHMKVTLTGPLTKGRLERLFWLVQPTTNTYHVLRLTDDDREDARRIQKLYRKLGSDVSEVDLSDRLSKSRLKAAKRHEVMMDSVNKQGGPQADSQEDGCASAGGTLGDDEDGQYAVSCFGSGWADLQVWELAAELGFNVDYLNETYVQTQWSHTIHPWGAQEFSLLYPTNGFCWANGNTFIHTHWYVLDCIPTGWVNSTGFDISLTGYFWNNDFPPVIYNYFGLYFPPVNTYVTSTPAVQFVNGFANWGANLNIDSDGGLLQWLEQHFFLTGEATGSAAENGGCFFFCDPSDEQIRECDNQIDYHYWDLNLCECVLGASPIIIDLEGNGLHLTSATDGVTFDVMADGRPVKVAWTRQGSSDAILVLDRNHNGQIDSGAELFGNFTAQPDPPDGKEKNGFLALAVFDHPRHGGNGDGQITEEDAIYADLRLWIDANHDGLAQPEELTTLAAHGVRALSLRYVTSEKKDEFGNVFRFRSHVTMDRHAFEHAPLKRQATDVFLSYIR